MAAARAWLFLALSALAGSVACAVLLVLMRAPGLATLLPARALFPSVLALHVDLAIVVWFLAMASAWFSVHTRPGRGDGAAATAGAIGAATMVAGGLASGGDAVMNNYLPVLRSPLFGIGLVTFFAAVAFAAIRAIADPSEAGAPWERLGARLAAGTTLVAFAAFAASLAGLPAGLDAHARYEALFWAGGHVLQFTHGGLLLTLWLVLAREGGVLRAPPRVVSALLVLGAAPVLAAAGGYGDPVGSIAHRAWFTGLMRWGTWPAAACVAAVVLAGWWRARPSDVATRPLRVALALSMGLYAVGLTLGALVRFDGLLVTAHYHGAVGAVTLAYMAGTRVLAGRVGLAVASRRVATVQAWAYGGGMALLVAGLAASGVLGLPRKTPQALFPSAGIAQTAALSLAVVGGVVGIAAIALFCGAAVRAMLAGGGEAPRPAIDSATCSRSS